MRIIRLKAVRRIMKNKIDTHVPPFGSRVLISHLKGVCSGHDLENLLPYKPARGFFSFEDTVKVFCSMACSDESVEYHKNIICRLIYLLSAANQRSMML